MAGLFVYCGGLSYLLLNRLFIGSCGGGSYARPKSGLSLLFVDDGIVAQREASTLLSFLI